MEQNVEVQTCPEAESKLPSKQFQFMATATSGLEFIAADDIKEKLQSQDVFVNKKELPGRILFSLPEQINEEALRTMLELKSLEHIYALVGKTTFDKEEKSSNFAKELPFKFSDQQWDDAFSAWKLYRRVTKGIKNKELLNSPSFRVTVKTAGQQAIRSVDFAKALAEPIRKKYPSWQPSTKGYELELFIYIRFTDVFVSISLTEASVSLQNVSKDRNLGATALRPSIAYGMSKMAKLAPGEVAMDPLCGCGTIPEIGSKVYPNNYFIAGDIASVAIDKTCFNFNASKITTGDIIHFDSTKLPFADGQIDAIITDLPFGKRIGSHKGNQELYPKLLKEFARVLKSDGGRAVILTAEKPLIEKELKEIDNLVLESWITINQGGLDTYIFKLNKKHKRQLEADQQQLTSQVTTDDNDHPVKKPKLDQN